MLNGPQGTLFGKNTVAGVLQITTKRPSFTFGSQLQADVQNYGGWGLAGSVTGPIAGDVVAGRLFASHNERDGYVPVTTASGRSLPKDGSEDAYTVRGQILVQPTQTFDVNLIGDYSRRSELCCAAATYQSGLPATLLNSLVPGSVIVTTAGASRGSARQAA